VPISTITSKGQTTVPKEVRDALNLEAGDKLTWEIHGGKIAISTDRPAFFAWEGFVKKSPGDVVKEIAEARKRRGRV
jgi:antitoxin PrlF